MSELIAVIDLGKSNSKLALVDTANACEIDVVTQPATILTDGPYPCLDHEGINAFIVDALNAACKKHDVDGLTVTTHGATAALVDDAGELVLPVLDYEFSGVDELETQYCELRPGFDETGSPKLPGGLNIGAQLYWQQRHFEKRFALASTILTWPQYWINQFSGALHNDVTSLGCHTDLYDPRNHCYSSLVNRLNIASLMPAAQQSGKYCGQLDDKLLRKIGVATDIPVYTGIHDSNASLVPHLVTQETAFSVVSTGTWFISMTVGGKDITLDEQRDTLYNVNAKGDAVPSARFMGGRERALLTSPGIERQDALHRLVKSSNTLPGLLMPSTVGNTGPYPNSSAHWIDEPVGDDALRDCIVALYLALMSAECLQLVGAQGPTFIEGPLADDKLYAQMLSIATDRPVRISDSVTGTSVGAAMLIKAPDRLPTNKEIVVDSPLKEFLQTYAVRWRQALKHHAK